MLKFLIPLFLVLVLLLFLLDQGDNRSSLPVKKVPVFTCRCIMDTIIVLERGRFNPPWDSFPADMTNKGANKVRITIRGSYSLSDGTIMGPEGYGSKSAAGALFPVPQARAGAAYVRSPDGTVYHGFSKGDYVECDKIGTYYVGINDTGSTNRYKGRMEYVFGLQSCAKSSAVGR